ncbi:MAG: PAS domain-containing protein [Anaerolineales bacterium]|nr:PAS domain-containing protein [Anaerolineales bacterium]
MFHYINRIGAQLLKRTVTDILGTRLHDLFPAEEADGLLANVRRVIASGQGMSEESPNLWAGRVRWSRTNLQPLRNADGQVAQVLVSSVDITDRKAAELVLEERVAARTAELRRSANGLNLPRTPQASASGIGIARPTNCSGTSRCSRFLAVRTPTSVVPSNHGELRPPRRPAGAERSLAGCSAPGTRVRFSVPHPLAGWQ